MNGELEQHLLLVIGALEFTGPQSFVFAGRPSTMWSNGHRGRQVSSQSAKRCKMRYTVTATRAAFKVRWKTLRPI